MTSPHDFNSPRKEPQRPEEETSRRRLPSAVSRYGLAVVSVILAFSVGLLLAHYKSPGDLSVFLFAIALTAWYAGVGPAVLATVCSVLCFAYFFSPDYSSFAFTVEDLPPAVILFSFSLLIIRFSAARRRVEGQLLHARDDLQLEVLERTQQATRLRRSEAYLAESQRLAKTGSWAWNLRTGELFWSKELCRMYGLEPQLKPTWPLFLTRVHPEDRAKIEQLAKTESTANDWTVFENEFRVVHPDGTLKHVHTISYRVTDNSGQRTEVIGTVMDVTERKRAEAERERLRQLEADLAHINRVSMMGELAAALAHEIKQPITAAVTNANTGLRWLARDQPDLEEARQAIMRIVSEGTRAAEIIDRLRSFYRKGVPPQPELVDLNDVAREMLMLLRDEANRYSIAMRTELDPDLPRVLTDRVQLQQVFINLMLNAIDAMKETAGELTIKSQLSKDGQLLISVSDTGVGLPAEKLEKIFDAFFTTKSHGTGMGLAITRSLVEAHGGRLWASPNSARGATFHFTLPTETSVSSTPAS